MKKRPFLAREALYWLPLLAPAITLLIANMETKPRLDRAVGCVLSTWVCTVVCGLTVHLLVNWLAPRLLSRLSLPLAIAGLATAVGTVVTGEMLVLLPHLVGLDPNVARPPTVFSLQALVVSALYVMGARLATWLGDRARDAQEL